MSIILENARDVQDKSKSGSGGSTFILNNLESGSQFTVNYLESVHLDASELLSDLSLRVRTPEGDFPPYTALVKGGHGNDNLGTYSAAVHFDGGAGNDVLTGNKGDDILQGGAGDDVLTGGAGKDIFFFGSLPADSGEHSADALIGAIGTDEITDFSTADGGVAQLWYDEKIGYTNADGGIVLIATLTNFKDLANLTGDNFA